ncbi:glycosyl transferase family protein [Sphingomonas sp. A2-49]|uniref:glycosyl transferase family protein n=1 Tax=Sphingomonas sp. A2-49 TaxID=1391375 RepID=UPI0021CE9CD6|nr:glycosyl transferase family protein [Sphingomonas sp. A2-49]MCU6455191.1 glycosyl transferase family protein [Sphingomonas sp. A2-49]
MDVLTGALDVMARETMLFAAAGLLIGGLDDLAVDLCFLVHRLFHWRTPPLRLESLAAPVVPRPFAVFVAAWDEQAVIGAMLSAAVARFDHPDYRLYVGVYPNDPGTIAAAGAVAATDRRIRIVVGERDGPTTKADCLNTLWHALVRDDAADARATAAVVLHDAEDMVHPAELTVFDALVDARAVVQLPVLPLIRRGSLVSGHYADEFAYAHSVQQPVRALLGAAMPLAGTGCAIATGLLAGIAEERGGAPFDDSSLTEDYELGLHVAARGGIGRFVRVRDPRDGSLVAVRAYFPETLVAATRQKARWMTGIALAGWDRTGWARPRAFADHWMRMRDRRAPLSVLVLAVAYVAVMLWPLALAAHWLGGRADGGDRLADWLLATTTALLGWRLAMRIACTGHAYGWREAGWSLPRFFVGNLVSLVAAPRALHRYWRLLRGAPLVWDKTTHVFPDDAMPAPAAPLPA